jgi:hypothetical protein
MEHDMTTPTPLDIADAITKIEEAEWIDPSEVTVHWDCKLYAPEGKEMGEGHADTAGEAMALAWIHAHAPDALINAEVELGQVPYNIPEGWRFELTPPQLTACLLRG